MSHHMTNIGAYFLCEVKQHDDHDGWDQLMATRIVHYTDTDFTTTYWDLGIQTDPSWTERINLETGGGRE